MKQKIKLDEDYTINGNSTGMQIDTLSIAIYGQDSNDFDDYSYHDNAIDYVINEYNHEDDFIKTLSKEDTTKYIKDKDAYIGALHGYTDKMNEAARLDDLPIGHKLYKEIEAARDSAADDFRKEWLYGDYQGNFDGVIPKAQRQYDIDIEYVAGTDAIYIDISEDKMHELKEDGYIDSIAHVKKAAECIADAINGDAAHNHRKEKAAREKRAAEYKKTKEWRDTCAKVDEEKRQKKLLAHIS